MQSCLCPWQRDLTKKLNGTKRVLLNDGEIYPDSRDLIGYPIVAGLNQVTQIGRGGKPCAVVYKGRILKAGKNKDGHLRVGCHTQAKQKRFFVHEAVLLAFVGPRPKGLICRHFPDPNPQNNNLNNLQWATPKVNQNDRFIHGTHLRGEKNPATKLTNEQAYAIRAEVKAGATKAATAMKYGVKIDVVYCISANKTFVQ